MTITTELDIGQTVYRLDNNKIVETTITEIRIEGNGCDEVKIYYRSGSTYIYKKDWCDTPQEVAQKLINDFKTAKESK